MRLQRLLSHSKLCDFEFQLEEAIAITEVIDTLIAMSKKLRGAAQ